MRPLFVAQIVETESKFFVFNRCMLQIENFAPNADSTCGSFLEAKPSLALETFWSTLLGMANRLLARKMHYFTEMQAKEMTRSSA